MHHPGTHDAHESHAAAPEGDVAPEGHGTAPEGHGAAPEGHGAAPEGHHPMAPVAAPHDAGAPTPGPSLNRLAAQATTHCLTGCAIGEVLGLAVATQLGWDDAGSIALAVVLAYIFGYALTLRPLLRSGLAIGAALGVAFAADTISITVMEIVDNAVILAIPGAMDAGLTDPLFWGALAFALGVAWLAAFPVNRWLLGRGMGHARAMAHHAGH